MRKKWLVLLLVGLLSISLLAPVCLYAQPEEEEEEPVQARPNPMEKTTRSKMSGRGSASSHMGDGRGPGGPRPTEWDPTDRGAAQTMKFKQAAKTARQGASKARRDLKTISKNAEFSALVRSVEKSIAEMERLAGQIEKQTGPAAKNSEKAMMELQTALHKQQQMIQTLSGIMKSMHDTAQAVVRNMK